MTKQSFLVNDLKITARRCRKSDYDFIFGIVRTMIFPFVREYFTPSKDMFIERFAKDYKERIVLMRGKRRIGFYQLAPDKNCLHIVGIFLSKAYQGKRIGTYLMKYFETLGYSTVRLQVWENNPAHSFYKNIGYEDISKENHKYLMEKKLFPR
jgi:ribosomal protein S18 acetylase RimI-like enzyme